jgi:hypothetical protein
MVNYRMRGITAALAVALMSASEPAAAAALIEPILKADVDVSTASAKDKKGKPPIEFKLGYRKAEGSHERDVIGVGVGMKEGKPLEMALWGAAGAVAGSLGGPFGAAVGGAVGVVAGLVYSHFFPPPADAKKKKR